MDTSEEYIEMCRAAKEIQSHWTAVYGDFAHTPMRDGMIADGVITIWGGADGEYAASTNHVQGDKIEEYEMIWLPRQDQLQAICTLDQLSDIFQCMANVCKKVQHFGEDSHISCEIVTLVGVMEYVYNKRWTGTEWV